MAPQPGTNHEATTGLSGSVTDKAEMLLLLAPALYPCVTTPSAGMTMATLNPDPHIQRGRMDRYGDRSRTGLRGIGRQRGKTEIIAVDDASTDGTAEALDALRVRYPGKPDGAAARAESGGKGGAIRTAIAHATGEFAVIQDSGPGVQSGGSAAGASAPVWKAMRT